MKRLLRDTPIMIFILSRPERLSPNDARGRAIVNPMLRQYIFNPHFLFDKYEELYMERILLIVLKY